MKFIKWISILLVSTLLLLITSLELFYFYSVNKIDPKKLVSDISYSSSALDILWVSMEESNEIMLEPYSATGFVYDFLKMAVFRNKNNIRLYFPKGISTSSQLARNFSSDKKYMIGHLNNLVLLIWISNNYTAKEALNSLFSTMYFGQKQYGLNNAAIFYFGRSSSDLNLSEIVTLVVITRSPSFYNPYCKREELIKRANYLSEKLNQKKPSLYGDFTYTFPELKENKETQCKSINPHS